MEKLFEFLINKIYRNYRQEFHYTAQNFLRTKVIKVVDNPQVWLDALDVSLNQPLLRFSGFEYNYDWYGVTQHNVAFGLGDWKIYEHVIRLNRHFLQNMMGYPNEENSDFTFPKLIKTLADEVSHCLIFDLYPNESGHSPKQKTIAKELETTLLKDKLVKLLKEHWVG